MQQKYYDCDICEERFLANEPLCKHLLKKLKLEKAIRRQSIKRRLIILKLQGLVDRQLERDRRRAVKNARDYRNIKIPPPSSLTRI